MGQVLGLDKVIGTIAKRYAQYEDKIVEAVKITESFVVNDARKLVRVRTGSLLRSIQEGPVKLEGTMVQGTVYALMEYASDQEYGPKSTTKKKWKFTPYLRPSLEKNKGNFIRLLKRAMS